MPKTLNIDEAKSYLSRILEEVADGSEVIITKAGKPIARRFRPSKGRRRSDSASSRESSGYHVTSMRHCPLTS